MTERSVVGAFTALKRRIAKKGGEGRGTRGVGDGEERTEGFLRFNAPTTLLSVKLCV